MSLRSRPTRLVVLTAAVAALPAAAPAVASASHAKPSKVSVTVTKTRGTDGDVHVIATGTVPSRGQLSTRVSAGSRVLCSAERKVSAAGTYAVRCSFRKRDLARLAGVQARSSGTVLTTIRLIFKEDREAIGGTVIIEYPIGA